MSRPTHESAQPDNDFRGDKPGAAVASHALGEKDLESALQLLVDRAQYITGATGAALALVQGSEMVCVASSGSSAPAIGARLQVQSGLTGEAISRKQLLRCDNAESDARVNLDTCHELGIASIVVLPLVSRAGQVRGLFELFSDHPYAFEERDLSALERMADLTRTALELSEKRTVKILVPKRPPEQVSTPGPSQPSTMPAPESTPPLTDDLAQPAPVLEASGVQSEAPASTPASEVLPSAEEVTRRLAQLPPSEELDRRPCPVPDAMFRVQKCASCGFPVSEGRSLCVDCEQKRHLEAGSSDAMLPEFVPTFGSAQASDESWLAAHVNLLAVLVLILSIAVAVVVFR